MPNECAKRDTHVDTVNFTTNPPHLGNGIRSEVTTHMQKVAHKLSIRIKIGDTE